MKKYIILSLILVSIFSCTEIGIEAYNESNYLSLTRGIKDTTRLSFFFLPSDEVDYPIEVNLIGKTLDRDMKYKIAIDKTITNAPDYIFKMPTEFTFSKGQLKDTFYIKLTNTEELKTKEYIIGYQVVDTDDFRSTGALWGRNIMTISDKATKPGWWTTVEEVELNSFQTVYLGKYSDCKYELFIQVTGVVDMGVLSDEDKRINSIIFKRWLKKQNPAIYDTVNGEIMQVTVIGE